jgi:hypothetical protein
MSTYLVKADDTCNIWVNGETVQTVFTIQNKFFVLDHLPTPFDHYYIEIPAEVQAGMLLYHFKNGKKQKVGVDMYKGTVAMVTYDDKPYRWFAEYTVEQEAQRLLVRKWIANQFIDDAVRIGAMTADQGAAHKTTVQGFVNNSDLDQFYIDHLMYDC